MRLSKPIRTRVLHIHRLELPIQIHRELNRAMPEHGLKLIHLPALLQEVIGEAVPQAVKRPILFVAIFELKFL